MVCLNTLLSTGSAHYQPQVPLLWEPAVLYVQTITGRLMAQKTVITLTDDIDGSEASETVVFGLDGTTYEIDLNYAHAEDLREVLAPFVAVARRAGGPAATRAPRAAAAPKQRSAGDIDPKAVRAWAEANGVEVNARGRLSATVIEQYKAANN